jgi:hypothetical protein
MKTDTNNETETRRLRDHIGAMSAVEREAEAMQKRVVQLVLAAQKRGAPETVTDRMAQAVATLFDARVLAADEVARGWIALDKLEKRSRRGALTEKMDRPARQMPKSGALTAKFGDALKRAGCVGLLLLTLATAHADDRDSDQHDRDSDHNYIIERQQAYQVEGVPTSRIIDGDREIDIYPNGEMFEGNVLVGIQQKGDDDDDR